jgi:uncharacterized membrane protein YagU involved in acid resistance
MKTLQTGFWAGILANGPMTMALFRLQKDLPIAPSSPLPPAKLTTDISEPVTKHISSNRRVDLMLLSHFAYSISCAVVYTWGARKVKNKSPLVKGACFGLGVWSLSYLGWIPALSSRASAPKSSPSKNLQMILAHLVWGTSLAYAVDELTKSGNQMLDGRQVK